MYSDGSTFSIYFSLEFKPKSPIIPPLNENSFLNNKRYRKKNPFNKSKFCDSESCQHSFYSKDSEICRQISAFQNQNSFKYDLSSNGSNSHIESKLKAPFKTEKTKKEGQKEEEERVEGENIQNMHANINNKTRNEKTRTTLPNTEEIKLMEKNNVTKKDKAIRKDNARNTVMSWYFKSLFNYVIKEYYKLKYLKLNEYEFSWVKKDFQRMLPLENQLRTKENFNVKSKISKKVKDILYTEKNPETFYTKKNQKTNRYIHIEQFKKNNDINKEIINKIEDLYEKKNKKISQKIKDNISNLYNIFNSKINAMYAEYIDMHNKRKPENFRSIEVDLNKLCQTTDNVDILLGESFNLAYD